MSAISYPFQYFLGTCYEWIEIIIPDTDSQWKTFNRAIPLKSTIKFEFDTPTISSSKLKVMRNEYTPIFTVLEI